MNSLRIRLFLAQVVVVMVAVGTIALLASRATNTEFQRYLERGRLLHQRRFDATFGLYYAEIGSWEGVQPLVDRLSQAFGERIILTDPSGRVVADSQHELGGRPLGSKWSAPGVAITFRNTSVGVVYFTPLSQPGNPAGEEFFLRAVNNWFMYAVLAAGLVAIVLTLVISRRILSPVSALTEAARKMEKGDLSQRVQIRTNDEIGELGRAFNAMADALARAETLRRNMVSDVAHELRTPLANIRGYLEALRDRVIESSPAVVESLYEEALLLNRLVDDLQDIALADAGQLKLVRRPVALGTVVQQAVDVMQAEAAARKLTLSASVPADLPAVNADAERIGQVLRNLLANAIAYTPEGGTVSVMARTAGAEVEVSVKDTGIGIAPEELPYVFERFYRVDKSRARKTGGTGLGLAIVKQLVQAHGGRVWAESTPGAGSTFAFTLPLEPV
jgi:signal transduction histidine kinase